MHVVGELEWPMLGGKVGAHRDFHVDDHKFFAVALAGGSGLMVFQALDREWWERSNDLNGAGLDVQFLCPGD